MPFRDVDMTEAVASAAEMREGAMDRYLAAIDSVLVAAAPDGYDASLDGPEWVAVRRAFANQVPAEAIALQIVQAREWLTDPNDTVMVALRMSESLAAMHKRVQVVETGLTRIADVVQGAPNRDDYDAVTLELNQIREQLRALSLQRVA